MHGEELGDDKMYQMRRWSDLPYTPAAVSQGNHHTARPRPWISCRFSFISRLPSLKVPTCTL
eukprot:scaffold105097_cov48-Prasinocladus_malaysianus.AAC.1